MTAGYLQTGQRRCYDAMGREIDCAGSGQDAESLRGLPWPHDRFQSQGALVLDRLTGLVWTRDANPAEFPMAWSEALAYVDGLNRERFYGHQDWRLPNRRELRSLVSHQSTRPVLPTQHPFRNIFGSWYWTGTTAAISPAHAWYVNMDGGRMFFGGKDQSFMVWPVRGDSRVLPVTGQTDCFAETGRPIQCLGTGQDGETMCGSDWPIPRFRVEGDQVFDRLTDLRWYRAADIAQGATNWQDALVMVRALNEHGRLGQHWRLPNINELESLLDCSTHSPALPRAHPFAQVGDVYWSSTTSTFEPDWAWALYLDKGAVGVGQKREAKFRVWAVC
jgi:hypothetical protein